MTNGCMLKKIVSTDFVPCTACLCVYFCMELVIVVRDNIHVLYGSTCPHLDTH